MKQYRKHSKDSSDVILLHGGPGAVGELNDLALALLERGLPVIEHFQNGHHIGDLIKDLKNLVENQATNKKAILVGHSWGAWLAWIFAARYPELTKGLILIASGSFHPDFNIDLTSRRTAKLPFKLKNEAVGLLQKLSQSKEISQRDFSRLGELMEKADTYCSAMIESSQKTIVFPLQHQSLWDEAQALRRSGELWAYADKISCPVIAFHGDFDSHPIDGVENPLKKRVRNFRMIKLEACGHYPWREKYARGVFFEELVKTIKSCY